MNDAIKKYLLDIKEAIDSIETYIGRNKDFKEYKQTKLLSAKAERFDFA